MDGCQFIEAPGLVSGSESVILSCLSCLALSLAQPIQSERCCFEWCCFDQCCFELVLHSHTVICFVHLLLISGVQRCRTGPGQKELDFSRHTHVRRQASSVCQAGSASAGPPHLRATASVPAARTLADSSVCRRGGRSSQGSACPGVATATKLSLRAYLSRTKHCHALPRGEIIPLRLLGHRSVSLTQVICPT